MMARGPKLSEEKLKDAREYLDRIVPLCRLLMGCLQWDYGTQKLGRKVKQVRHRRRDRCHYGIHVEPPHVVLQHILPPTQENLREIGPGIRYEWTPRAAPSPQISIFSSFD